MDKNSVAIVNSMIDKFLDMDLKRVYTAHGNDMWYIKLCEEDKRVLIERDQLQVKKYYCDWRKRSDESINQELEKEYGKLNA